MTYQFNTDGDYVDFKVGGVTAQRLHNTCQAVEWVFAEDDGLIFKVNGGYYFTEDPANISFDGAPCATKGGFVTAIKAAFPVYAGGGSSESLLKTATVELTDAQIKTLPTTPFELVAAQGAGKAIIPVSCIAISNFTAGAYTNITGASWQLAVDGMTIGSPFDAFTALGYTGAIYVSQIPCVDFYTGAGDFAGSSITFPIVTTLSYDNKALDLSDVFGGVTNYTGGNAANALKVIVQYVVIDL